MESMKQRMLGGKLYKANDPEISVESQRGSDLVWQFNHLAPDKKAERAAVLKQLFHAFGVWMFHGILYNMSILTN